MVTLEVLSLDRYYGLVRYHAKKVHGLLLAAGVETIEVEDLRQEGFVGLLEARRTYDPKKGAAFTTHASRRIYGAVKDHLRRLDPLTQKERKQVKKLDRAREKLIASLGRKPTIEELAEEMSLTNADVRKIEALRVVLVSMDAGEESEGSPFPELASEGNNPEQEEVLVEQREKIAQDVNDCLEEALCEQERRVLIFRVRDKLTLEQVGRFEKVSKDSVKRREVAAKSKMRRCLESKDWQVADILGLVP